MAGKIVHIELPAKDTGRAMEFWSSLQGWEFKSMDGPMEYHMFEAEPAGAIYPSQSGERGPVVYFGSDDIDADIAQIRGLGGQAENKTAIPHVGWFARCEDTEGNAFSLFQSDESVPAE
jgi:predicted enzyme related to lactoylglutathione lyase